MRITFFVESTFNIGQFLLNMDFWLKVERELQTIDIPNHIKNRKLIKIISNHLTKDDTKSEVPVESAVNSNPNESSLIARRTMYFINKLRSNAENNLSTTKEGYRYDIETKLYAAYLRMICGPMGYNTLQRNLVAALPSLISTNRYINTARFFVPEGVLRCQELHQYLNDRNLPLAISLSEDATRIVGRLQYNRKTNQIIGFTLPTDSRTGMPIPLSYPANNAQCILDHFAANHSISSFVNVIMAQPLGNYPALCLSIYGSDCKYSSTDVENKWTFITTELMKFNIKVLTISSDSDPKYNRAMRKLFATNFKSVQSNCFSNGLKKIHCPFFVQDPTHIGTKLRNFLLGFSKNPLPFGPKHFINIQHLYFLLQNFPKDLIFSQHLC